MAGRTDLLLNGCMDETFRMLGAEHAADLERHAANWQRAKRLLNDPTQAARAQQPTPTRQNTKRAKLSMLIPRLRN